MPDDDGDTSTSTVAVESEEECCIKEAFWATIHFTVSRFEQL